MKASEAKLLDLLKRSPQFVIPIYQRTYSWTERECRQLWDDILRSGRDGAVTGHFVGSIVYVEKGLYQITGASPLLVIDGQQRLTTVTLLIEALARAVGEGEPLDGFSAKKLRNYYLLNPLEEGERRYKLILSQADRASLTALLDNQPRPKDHSLRVEGNFRLFEQWLAANKDDVVALCCGLAKLIVVDISLSREQDNPQLIFESLNSTGRELSQADLIRNFVLMGLEPQLQASLYETYWRPMEIDFGQEAYAQQFDAFMRHYLTVKSGEIPNVREVYDAFKQYARGPKAGDTQRLVAEVRQYSGHFCGMALGAEQDPELRLAFQDIRELKADVVFPFFLELYDDYVEGRLARSELLTAVRLVESYVFRRVICGIPTNSHNNTFATLARSLSKDRYLESIQAHLLTLPSYRRFPSDEEFKRDLQVRDLYTSFPRRSYMLRRLENHGRKERISVDEYTIEHIMPQNPNLSPEWRTMLGTDWSRVHETYLHTLGNLTLTGYNIEYSDRPFAAKRDMDGGFAQSPLHLNRGLGSLSAWNEEAIRQRAARLADLAARVWPVPVADDAALEACRPRRTAVTYTVDDHRHLRGPLLDLFEAFRAQVLALDPCVTEEFLKRYVAYKAETNFVDVIAQTSRLRLSLNMPFRELEDPRGLCRDISGVSRWGNGDVELYVSRAEDLPYAIGLVRQSLERQMGEVA